MSLARPRPPRWLTTVILVTLALFAWYLERPTPPAAPPAAPPSASATAPSEVGIGAVVVPGVRVRDRGRLVHDGDVDLSATVRRIQAGEHFPHRNDGAVFQNRERRLPAQARGYYREYVHPTPGVGGPGPQRVIVGRGGEWYYTPDHYGSFVRLAVGEHLRTGS